MLLGWVSLGNAPHWMQPSPSSQVHAGLWMHPNMLSTMPAPHFPSLVNAPPWMHPSFPFLVNIPPGYTSTFQSL